MTSYDPLHDPILRYVVAVVDSNKNGKETQIYDAIYPLVIRHGYGKTHLK